MKMENSNSKIRFNNYKDLNKYVIYVNPKQYVRMMRRRLERDRFMDRKGRPKKVYVPIAIREVTKRLIQHDDLLGDISKIKKIPSKRETPKNYEGLMSNPNCNNINIYINNPINNSNQVNNSVSNNNISTNNFNSGNINYNINNNMSNWPCFYWNMSGYYNMNTSGYSPVYSNCIGSDPINAYQNNGNSSSGNSSNTGNSNSGISIGAVKSVDCNTYNPSANMIYPNNCYYYNNTTNTSGGSSNTSNNGSTMISGSNTSSCSNSSSTNKTSTTTSINNSNMINTNNSYGSPNASNSKSKMISNEELASLIQGGFSKTCEGLMGSAGYSTTPSSSSSYYNISSPNNINSMYITNNFDSSSFSSTFGAMNGPGSVIESHSSMSTSSGCYVPPTEREKSHNKGSSTMNSREEIMNNYINLNNSPFSECSIDGEVVCKTDHIYNINQNGTVIDTSLGNEMSIGLNEPTFFNNNFMGNIDQNVIGNLIDTNCVETSCYLETSSDGTYNETHLQSILMDQNSINTNSTIINDQDLIFNTGNSTSNNSINTSASIHSLHNFGKRIQGDGREQSGIPSNQYDSTDSTYIYRQLCDYF